MDVLVIAFVLLSATLLIAWLCWVWMRASRASKQRMEDNDRRIIALLEEQNELLRSMRNHQS